MALTGTMRLLACGAIFSIMELMADEINESRSSKARELREL